MRFIGLKQNWRTYLVVATGLGLGIADRFNVRVPTVAMWAVKLLGQGDLREAIRAESKQSASDLVELVAAILAKVELPDSNADVTGVKIPSPPPVEVHDLPPINTADKVG